MHCVRNSSPSESAIDRLSTPKHMQSKKKVFTNTPKISAKSDYILKSIHIHFAPEIARGHIYVI